MIYQILIDRFNGGWKVPPRNSNEYLGGTLRGITEKLDYIKSLGTTSIWLSPFFRNAAYHGYHTVDYENIDPHFGSWEDLADLIISAHQKEICVIADFVPNHCHISHPFFLDAVNNPQKSKYRDWFYFKNSQSSKCLHFLNYSELVKFNLDNPATKDYFIKVGEHLTNIGIDGFRIDHALGISMAFLKAFRQRMHEINPNTIVFGEVWPFNIQRRYYNTLRFRSFWRKCFCWFWGFNQETIQLDYSDSLDAVLDFEFHRLLLHEVKNGRRLLNNERLKLKLQKHFSHYQSGLQVIPFLDNHDTNRFLFYCNGDDSLLEEGVEMLKESGKEYVIYYGTECRMCNKTTIFDAEPYADILVREPMKW